MITIYTVWKNKIIHKKYYKNSTEQTRSHYILTLRQANLANYELLDVIKEHNVAFVDRASIPYREDFYFVIEEVPIYGSQVDKVFYVYSFQINADVNTTIVYTDDSYDTRCDFIEEVKGYLMDNEYFELMSNLFPYFNEFRYTDNEYLTVEKNNFSMKKEDS